MEHLITCLKLPNCGCELLGNPIDRVKEGEYKPEHTCDSRCNNSVDCEMSSEEDSFLAEQNAILEAIDHGANPLNY